MYTSNNMTIYTEKEQELLKDTTALGFDKHLVKIDPAASAVSLLVPELRSIFSEGVAPKIITSGELFAPIEQTAQAIFSGKTGFNNTQTGYRLGVDGVDGLAKFYIGNSTDYINWNGSSLTIVGGVTIDSLDIGGADATSFHVDVDGNMWLGAATFAGAPAKVSNAGAATFSNVTITGGSITIGGLTTVNTDG